MNSSRTPGTSLVLAIACALLGGSLAGCGGDDGGAPTPAPTPSVTSPTASATPTPTPSASASALPGASTKPVSKRSTSSTASLLRAARLAGQEGYDRFVLQFSGAVPGYDVRYVPRPITEDPSDRPVAVKGDAVLRIRLEPASGVDLTSPSATVTYTGAKRLRADTDVVNEAVLIGDFESVMTWVLGVDGRQPFLVTTLSDPSRLVIDVSTAAG